MQSRYPQFVDEAFVRLLRHTPEIVAKMGYAELPAFAGLGAKLNGYSIDALQRRLQVVNDLWQEHRRYERASLPASDQLTWDVFDFFLRYTPFEPWIGVEGRDFALHPYPVRHFGGAPAETFNVLVNMHEVRNERNAEDYLVRLAQLDPTCRDLAAGLAHRHAVGIVPARSSLAIVRRELDTLLTAGARRSELVESFAQKLADAGIGEDRSYHLHSEAQRIATDLFKGGLAVLRDALVELESKSDDRLGVWRLPRGDEYYDYMLGRETSTALTPDEIFDLGKQEVARLRAELARDAAALGFGGADLAGALRAALKADGAAAGDTPSHRAEILAHYRHLVDDTTQRIRPHFGRFPRARCIVRATPAHLEQRRTTTYYPPSVSGAYPGAFELCVLREIGKAPWARHQLSYHEAVPGHHLQLTIAQEADHLPLMRRAFIVAAFLEGWAKYAERLPFETGLDTDPRVELSRKSYELISASNLMLDVGIHVRRWSRDEAVQFSAEQALLERPMAEYLVDRLAVAPAQATAYTIGLSKVRALRSQLQRARGARFALPEFHDLLLAEGALPLDVLQRRFDRVLAEAA